MSNMLFKASAEEKILNPECSKPVFIFISKPEFEVLTLSFSEETQGKYLKITIFGL